MNADAAQPKARMATPEVDVLIDALEEALAYFQDRSDVVDGSYGEPQANREMQLAQTMEAALWLARHTGEAA
jgi:hypothetical protein